MSVLHSLAQQVNHQQQEQTEGDLTLSKQHAETCYPTVIHFCKLVSSVRQLLQANRQFTEK